MNWNKSLNVGVINIALTFFVTKKAEANTNSAFFI